MEQPPIAIAITWGRNMIEEKGGLLSFLRYFERFMSECEDGYWLHRSKNCPKHDIAHVYIVVHNRVLYRLYYGGYQTGETEVFNGDGHSWSSRSIVSWPRIVIAGPFEKAPRKIHMKGFQGFRYLQNDLW